MREINYVREFIAQKKIPKVSLWYGDEHFLLEEALQVLKGAFLSEDSSGSCIETLSAREVSPENIVEAANTFSFFQNRLVLVPDVTYFQEGSVVDLEPLLRYFDNPNLSTCLVLIATSIHKGRKFYKAIEQKGTILEFTAPKSPQDWQAWVRSELQARGKEMSSDTVVFLLDWAGHQAGVLSQEIDKLAAFSGQRKVITKEDIQEVVIRTTEATVFELLDAIAKRSSDQAITKLHEVLRAEHPLKVMTLLVRQVRLLLGALTWREQGRSSTGLAEVMGIKPFEAQKIWTQSMKMSYPLLVDGLRECLKTEIALKNGGGEPVFLLEMMIIRFCK